MSNNSNKNCIASKLNDIYVIDNELSGSVLNVIKSGSGLDYNYYIYGESCYEFDIILNKLRNEYKQYEFSNREIENALFVEFYKVKKANKQITTSDLDKVFLSLNNKPLIETDNWAAIDLIKSGSDFLYIYDKLYICKGRKIIDSLPAFSNVDMINAKKYYLHLKISSKSRDVNRIYKDKYREIELMINAIYSRVQNALVLGIVNFYDNEHNIISKSDRTLTTSKLYDNMLFHVKFEKLLSDHKIFANQVWEIYFKNNKSKMENRILKSLVFAGQSLTEYNVSTSYLNICMAFEAIFTNSNRDINPSISFSLKYYTAIICYDTYEKRQVVINKLADLYKIRSKVAHGASNDISEVKLSIITDLL